MSISSHEKTGNIVHNYVHNIITIRNTADKISTPLSITLLSTMSETCVDNVHNHGKRIVMNIVDNACKHEIQAPYSPFCLRVSTDWLQECRDQPQVCKNALHGWNTRPIFHTKKKYTAGISRHYQQMLSITVNNLFIRYQQNIRPGFGSMAKTAVCTQILTMQISYSIFNNAIYTYLSIAKQGCSEK